MSTMMIERRPLRHPVERKGLDPLDELEEFDVSVLEIGGGHDAADDDVDVEGLIGY